MNIAAITGPSGAGKSTLITKLIPRYLAQGHRVACIKHTHHPLNEEDRGDTARFRAAGANPVLLAREGEAVIFDRDTTRRVHYTHPQDLLAYVDDANIVLIEGFKHTNAWPQLTITDDARPTVDQALEQLAHLWTP
jgi:molybdopterin-guanine dinucleotide biosynthesis protein MobB